MSDPTPVSTEPALSLEGVDVVSSRDPGSLSVEGINWSVLPGEFWVVGGLLRSGKSDLLSTLAGMLPAVRGVVRLFGRTLAPPRGDGDLAHRLRLGLVQEGGVLLRHLTVVENIALPLRYHHNLTMEEAAPRLGAWIEALEMEDIGFESSSRVSRNWAIRAGLARACVLGPEVLLVDSPLSGLDPQHTAWWIAFLRSLASGHALMNYRPLTVVVSCDRFLPWAEEGRRFAMLREGRLEVLPAGSDPTALERRLVDYDV